MEVLIQAYWWGLFISRAATPDLSHVPAWCTRPERLHPQRELA